VQGGERTVDGSGDLFPAEMLHFVLKTRRTTTKTRTNRDKHTDTHTYTHTHTRTHAHTHTHTSNATHARKGLAGTTRLWTASCVCIMNCIHHACVLCLKLVLQCFCCVRQQPLQPSPSILHPQSRQQPLTV
jgi:hypothetical protein